MRGAIVAVVLVACAHGPRRFATPEDELAYAARMLDEGRWTRAAASYDHVFAQIGLPSADAAVKRAHVGLLLDDEAGCLAIADRGLARFPDAPELHETRALCLYRLDRRREARLAAEAALARAPTRFAASYLLADLVERDDPARAARAFQTYLDHRPETLVPQDDLARLRRAFALLNAGDGEAALRALATIEDRRVLYRRSVRRGVCFAHALLDHARAGIAQCKQALGAGDEAALWHALARLYAVVGNTARAAEARRRAGPQRSRAPWLDWQIGVETWPAD